MKVDSCERIIAGFLLKNKGNGDNRRWLSKEFRVSGSVSDSGPWQKLVETELADTRHKPAALLNFTFDQPVRTQFLKFDLISYWELGSNYGGGLQYFWPILSEGIFHVCCTFSLFDQKKLPVECNITSWTSWSSCCKGETKRRRVIVAQDECKNQTVSNSCTVEQCPGAQVSFEKKFFILCSVDCVLGAWSHWSQCQPACDLIPQSNEIPITNPCELRITNRFYQPLSTCTILFRHYPCLPVH